MKKVWVAGRSEDVVNYVDALEKTGVKPVVSIEVPDREDFTADEYAALLLPGGDDVDPSFFGQENHGSRKIDRELDTAQFAILDLFVKAKKPVMGICKGCQVLNIYFKGTIIQDLENNVHHQAYQGKAVKHKAVTEKGNLFYELYGGGEIIINSSHHQAIDRLGDGFRVCQYSDDHVPEAIQHETLPIIGIQWHPERMAYDKHVDGEADGTLLFAAFRKMMEETV